MCKLKYKENKQIFAIKLSWFYIMQARNIKKLI